MIRKAALPVIESENFDERYRSCRIGRRRQTDREGQKIGRALHPSRMEARLRGIQYELQFHRSFNAYRERKGIPALNGDLRAGS